MGNASKIYDERGYVSVPTMSFKPLPYFQTTVAENIAHSYEMKGAGARSKSLRKQKERQGGASAAGYAHRLPSL